MTIASETQRADFIGSGSAGPFSFLFRILDASHLEVIRRDVTSNLETVLAYSTDYSVDGVNDTNGGSITLIDALTTDEVLSIRRVVPLTQESNFRDLGRFRPEFHEDAYDKQVMGLQQLQDGMDRSFQLLPSFDPSTFDMSVTPEANRVLVWSADGTALESKILDDSDNVALPAAGRTITSLTELLANMVEFNVRDYGAIGNGVHDDTTNIQAAITAAAANGGVVKVPAGTYKVTNTLTHATGVIIRGEGVKSSIVATAMTGKAVIAAVSKTACVVENIKISGLCAVGVYLDTCTFATVRGCEVTGATTPDAVLGYANGIWAMHCSDILIEDNYCHDNGTGNNVNLSSDIQLNGSGYLGYARNLILNNRCTSTAVHTNIAAYNTQDSRIAGNTCTGAFTRAADNSGYGIMSYHSGPALWSALTTYVIGDYVQQVNSDGIHDVYVAILGGLNHQPPNSTYWSLVSGPNRDVEISGNVVYDTQGCGIYSQGCERAKIVNNTVRNTGTVQTDAALLSGGIGVNTGAGVSVLGNKVTDFKRSGITLCNLTNAICANNAILGTLAASKSERGIWIRGANTRVRVEANDVAQVSLTGIGTTTTFYDTTSCAVISNNVLSAGDCGIELDGAISCTISKNTVRLSAKHGIVVTVGDSGLGINNVVTDNIVTDSSQVSAAFYSHIVIGTPQTKVDGNVMANLLADGAKFGVSVDAAGSVRTAVVGNLSKDARTADFSLPVGTAAGGNVATANIGSFTLGHVAQFTGQGTDGPQLLMGETSSYGAVGAVGSSGDVFSASNAQHGVTTAGVLTWHQNNAAARSVLIICGSVAGQPSFAVHLAAAGTADGNFATFWGTPIVEFDSIGAMKIGGNYVVKARGAAVADNTAVATADATDLASVITLANALKAALNTEIASNNALKARLRAATGHGLIA